MAEAERRDFFISYTRVDRTWAEWIAWVLEEAGYSTIIQAWDFRPGTNFVHSMDEALDKGQRLLAVLSPDYLRSRFTRPEWYAAFAQDSLGENEELLLCALPIGEQKLGVNDLNVAKVRNVLGLLYRAQGRYSEAESLFQRALATLEAVLNPNHLDIRIVRDNLVALQADMQAAEPPENSPPLKPPMN